MKYRQWSVASPDAALRSALEGAGLPPLLASILAARGIHSGDQAQQLLSPGGESLLSPLLMLGMDQAAARVRLALERGEQIAVYGDYDVDGITATCLLTEFLSGEGGAVLPYIPGRLEEGYGLNREAIASLARQGVTLIVTVDCGITAVDEVAFASQLGVDVVITDHHTCKGILPDAVAVVDPHQPGCPYPFKGLAGVGVALKLAMAVAGSERACKVWESSCDLAAIGTVADVMPMTGENRRIVSAGLARLNPSRRLGLARLISLSGQGDRPISSVSVGYTLAPRINASGRMGRAEAALELLMTGDPERAEELAQELCAPNRERQTGEAPQAEALVLAGRAWHQGVVDIVASRLAEKYARPCFMICLDQGMGKGSCRSWGGINLFELLEECAPLLESFGGHALAAGFTVREERIPALAQALAQAVAERAQGTELPSVLEADGVVPPELLTVEEVSALDRLEPCGVGNPRPVLVLSGVQIHSMAQVGRGRHLKLKLESRGILLDAIWFSADGGELGLSPGCRVDAAFYPQINEFRGCRSVQLQIIDLRPAPSRAQMEQAIYDKYRRDEALTPQEARFLLPSREEFVCLWKWLDRHCSPGGPLEDTLPRISRAVARSGRQVEVPARTLLCLEVLEERGLIQLGRSAGRLQITLNRLEGKVDLDASLLLRRLRDVLRE